MRSCPVRSAALISSMCVTTVIKRQEYSGPSVKCVCDGEGRKTCVFRACSPSFTFRQALMWNVMHWLCWIEVTLKVWCPTQKLGPWCERALRVLRGARTQKTDCRTTNWRPMCPKQQRDWSVASWSKTPGVRVPSVPITLRGRLSETLQAWFHIQLFRIACPSPVRCPQLKWPLKADFQRPVNFLTPWWDLVCKGFKLKNKNKKTSKLKMTCKNAPWMPLYEGFPGMSDWKETQGRPRICWKRLVSRLSREQFGLLPKEVAGPSLPAQTAAPTTQLWNK